MRRGLLRSITSLANCGIVLAVGGCNEPGTSGLLDGCYYLDKKPILSIRGVEGHLLIPGDVSQFRLVPEESSDHIWMTTQPRFAIGGGAQKHVNSVANSASPTPVIIIETEGQGSSHILVHDNGEVARLVREDSCAVERGA